MNNWFSNKRIRFKRHVGSGQEEANINLYSGKAGQMAPDGGAPMPPVPKLEPSDTMQGWRILNLLKIGFGA